MLKLPKEEENMMTGSANVHLIEYVWMNKSIDIYLLKEYDLIDKICNYLISGVKLKCING